MADRVAPESRNKQRVNQEFSTQISLDQNVRQNPRSNRIITPSIPQATNLELGVLDAVSKFGSKQFIEAAEKRAGRLRAEGAIAFQQGQAINEINTDSSGFMLEGFQNLETKTSLSKLKTTLLTEIEQGGFSSSPEQFRQQIADRAEKLLDGTEGISRQTLAAGLSQMLPELVATHTRGNMRFREKRAKEDIENSIDLLSRDPTNSLEFLEFVTGEGGTGGLPPDVRNESVVNGVIRAFENDNPNAFSILSSQGVLPDLDGEADENTSFDPKDIRKLRNAKIAYENRQRGKLDVGRIKQEAKFQEMVASGELTGVEAVNKAEELFDKHNIQLTQSEGTTIFGKAQQATSDAKDARRLGVQAAILDGELDKAADMTADIIVQIESGGDINAVSPTGAKSQFQVMDATNVQPGFGVLPAQDNSLEERARVGRDYWRAMVNRYNGDLELAAIAFNAGPGNADAFVEAGRDWEAAQFTTSAAKAQAKDYVKKFDKRFKGDRFIAAETKAKEARKLLKKKVTAKRDEREARITAVVEPQLDAIGRSITNGEVSLEVGLAKMRKLRKEHDLSFDAESAEREVALKNEVAIQAAKRQDKQTKLKLNARVDAADEKFKRDLEEIANIPSEGRTPQEQAELQVNLMRQASREHNSAINGAALDLDVDLLDGSAFDVEQSDAQARRLVFDTQRDIQDQAELRVKANEAVRTGTLDTVDDSVQELAFNDRMSQLEVKKNFLVETGQIKSREEADAFIQQGVRDFIIQSGFVPKRRRAVNSTALTGRFVEKDGTVNPRARDAILSYLDIKQNNPGAAEQFLNPKAAAVAEAVIDRTNGDPNLIPQALVNIWEEGASSPFERGPDPNFLERPEVQEGIRKAVGDKNLIGRMWSSIFGESPIEELDLTEQNTNIAKNLIEQEVLAIHQENTSLNPLDLINRATEKVAGKMVPVGNKILFSSNGNDIVGATFGNRPETQSLREDPRAVDKALTSFINSNEFKQEFLIDPTTGSPVDPEPNLGFFNSIKKGVIDVGLSVAKLGGIGDPIKDVSELSENQRLIVAAAREEALFEVNGVVNGVISVDIIVNDQNNKTSRIPVQFNINRAGKFWLNRQATKKR